ncbi:MAG: carbohydrate porin [Pseudomonadota bacterium]
MRLTERGRERATLESRNVFAACVRKAVFAGAALMTMVALPSVAQAACEIPEDYRDPFATGANGRLNLIDKPLKGTYDALNRAGIDVGGAYVAEPFYNWGGLKDGGQYNGVLELYMNADMKKLGLWDGLCFHVNGYQIHGNSISGVNVGSLMPVTSFEADPATRLFELWFEQFLFNDRVSVRFGQLAADEEFYAADGGGFFINGTWGWSPLPAENLPGGGPAYPIATPGVRVALAPTDDTSVLIGVFNGNPAPDCPADDAQACNPDGLDFGLRDNALLMVEGAYSYSVGGGTLPGTIKLGGWNHFGDADDLITGRPKESEYALYIILDQLLWQAPDGEEGQGIGFFTRFTGAPDSISFVDFYFDVGLTFTGMIPGRPDDALAVGYAYTGISSNAQTASVNDGGVKGNGYEGLIEVAYTMEVIDGWTLQPDFQYFFNPGAGFDGADDAAVVGARSTFAF